MTTADMDANEIAQYLKRHPEFFEQYAELLAQIHIPSPHGGRAISITERQIGSLRDTVKQLEAKLAELIRFGEENDVISGKVHRLGVELQGAVGIDAVLRALYSHLVDDFAVPHVALRIWGIGRAEGPEFAAVADDVKAGVGQARVPYCGTSAGQSAMAWLGEAGSHARSLALIPLREAGTGAAFGALLLASEEVQRFYPEMGTHFLTQIGDIISAALQRVLV